jgi:glycosyltransferase involved in cell wall biosynthesis
MQALEVTDHLRRRGYPVWLASCTGSRLAREAESRGITVVTYPVSGYLHPAVIVSLSRFIRRNRIRIIHCQLSKDLSTAVPAADLSLVHPHIILSKRVGSSLTKTDPFHRYTYAHVDRVLAISSVIHRNVLATTPMTADKVITLHDAIDIDQFSPARARRADVRTALGFQAGDVVAGCVGRFSPGKGHEELLQAAATVRADYPQVRFLIVGEATAGEDAYARQIRALAESLQLGDGVIFAGFRRDVPDVMASCDIFAFPSHAESFGVVLIEAMAMELPVVSTNCDGVLDIVVDGKTGLYVPPHNSTALAAAITRLAVDPEMRRRFGKAGRERVLELFERKRQMDRLEGIYREVLHE